MRTPELSTSEIDAQLLQVIQAAVGRKHFKHAGMPDLEALAQQAREGRPMITIGG